MTASCPAVKPGSCPRQDLKGSAAGSENTVGAVCKILKANWLIQELKKVCLVDAGMGLPLMRASARLGTNDIPGMPKNVDQLIVSYDEAGAALRRHVADEVRMETGTVWEASFRNLNEAQLPPGDGLILVYPVFMQSGGTVTQALPEQLRALYAAKGISPELEFKPVWGAERGFDPGVNAALALELKGDASLLVVAHGVRGRELPPEPHEWIRRLHAVLPEAGDMAVAYFEGSPSVEEILPTLHGRKVVVMPFLAGEGHHMKADMPTPELAARFGKELHILPPLGVFYLQAEREYREGRLKCSAEETNGID